VTGSRKGRGDMGFIERKTRFGEGTRPTIYFDPSTNQPGGSGEQSQVIDNTISDNQLPNTGGPSLPGLAVIALGLAVIGGATVVGTGVRRRDR
jgi:hypothetical protein